MFQEFWLPNLPRILNCAEVDVVKRYQLKEEHGNVYKFERCIARLARIPDSFAAMVPPRAGCSSEYRHSFLKKRSRKKRKRTLKIKNNSCVLSYLFCIPYLLILSTVRGHRKKRKEKQRQFCQSQLLSFGCRQCTGKCSRVSAESCSNCWHLNCLRNERNQRQAGTLRMLNRLKWAFVHLRGLVQAVRLVRRIWNERLRIVALVR